MSPPPNPAVASPADGTPRWARARPAPAASAPASSPAAGPDAWFRAEMDRAAERAGGKEELEARRDELAGARRDQRAEGFGARSERRLRADAARDEAPAGSAGAERAGVERAAIAPPESDAVGSGGPAAALEVAAPPPPSAGGAGAAPQARGTADAVAPPPAVPSGAPVAASASPPGTPSSAPAASAGPTASAGSATAVDAPAGTARVERAPRPALPAPPPEEPAPDPAHVQRAERVLAQLRAALRTGTRHLTLDLVPAELGRLSIHVASRRGRISAIVRAESAETHELLQRHVPELRALLERAGLTPDDVELRHGFSDAGAGAGSGDARDRAASVPTGSRPVLRAPTSTEPTAAVPAGRALRVPSTGGVDTYA